MNAKQDRTSKHYLPLYCDRSSILKTAQQHMIKTHSCKENRNFLTSASVLEIAVDNSSFVRFNLCSKLLRPVFN